MNPICVSVHANGPISIECSRAMLEMITNAVGMYGDRSTPKNRELHKAGYDALWLAYIATLNSTDPEVCDSALDVPPGGCSA